LSLSRIPVVSSVAGGDNGEVYNVNADTAAAVLAVALGAYAKTSTPLLEHVPLQWKPTSELKLGTMEVSQAPIQFETWPPAIRFTVMVGRSPACGELDRE